MPPSFAEVRFQEHEVKKNKSFQTINGSLNYCFVCDIFSTISTWKVYDLEKGFDVKHLDKHEKLNFWESEFMTAQEEQYENQAEKGFFASNMFFFSHAGQCFQLLSC